MKGYVLWTRHESPVVRRDREGDDRLGLVATLEGLVPLGARIAALVIDDGDRWEERSSTTAPADDAVGDDAHLAPVTSIFDARSAGGGMSRSASVSASASVLQARAAGARRSARR